jgi:serologically defined colon cancer antigen 8
MVNREVHEIEAQKRQAIADLEAETKMWEEKYENRDTRPEDLERIQKLEELIQERSEAIEKVQQELKHYQTELMNREKTYNKVFNNRPQVTVLSGLERRAKRDAMIASVSMSASTPLPPLPGSKGGSPRQIVSPPT